MPIEKLSENVILIVLPKEPHLSDELKDINEMISKRCDCDVIVDFSIVQIFTSVSISNLMVLRNLLNGCGHRLILCSVLFLTKCIFRVAGLNEVFDFVDDKHAALEALNSASEPVN